MALYRCLSGGGTKTATGTYTASTTAQTTIDLGFKPKQLTITAFEGSSLKGIYSYDENVSTTTQAVAGSTSYLGQGNLGTTSAGRIYSINSNGFTVNKSNAARTCHYFAIG